MTPKYPNITVNIVGRDGNAFSILAECQFKMRKAKVTINEIESFYNTATNGDYDHLLRTVIEYFNIGEES